MTLVSPQENLCFVLVVVKGGEMRLEQEGVERWGGKIMTAERKINEDVELLWGTSICFQLVDILA